MAQFRLDVIDHIWRLYCPNLKRGDSKRLLPDAEPSRDFEDMLNDLDLD